MKSFKQKSKVLIYPSLVGGWYFVYVDKKIAEKIRKVAKTYGGGFVKIEAQIGKTVWQTALFPYKREDTYLIFIKKLIRQKEDVFEGEFVDIKIKLI